MGDKIQFSNFEISDKYICCTCKTYSNNSEEKMDKLEFKFNKSISVRNDLIALALSTLCGKSYSNIYFDLEINQSTYNELKKFTNANIEVLKINNTETISETRKNKDNIILNFSGGFDSLAALCVMPKNTKLVAIDFGGWFERETAFFKKFNPYTVSTNFRQLKYDRSSWTFMGVAAILFSDYLEAKYNVFGTILEGTTYHFHEFENNSINVTIPPFSSAGLNDIKYIAGLTEVGTAMVITYYKPEIVNESLISLSNPGTEKRYRKQLLTQIVCEKYNRSIEIDITEPPKTKISFGDNFALDFLALYEIKNAGLEEANKTICNIPREAVELVDKLKLVFYEKLNTNFLNSIPENLRKDYLAKLADANIYPYDEQDWKEFRLVTEFLSQYHEGLKRKTQQDTQGQKKNKLMQQLINKIIK